MDVATAETGQSSSKAEAPLWNPLICASGLVGSEVTAALKRERFRVRAAVRSFRAPGRRIPADEFIALDLRFAIEQADWGLLLLNDVFAVANFADVLPDSFVRHAWLPLRKQRNHH